LPVTRPKAEHFGGKIDPHTALEVMVGLSLVQVFKEVVGTGEVDTATVFNGLDPRPTAR
jgi:hypothetical protein